MSGSVLRENDDNDIASLAKKKMTSLTEGVIGKPLSIDTDRILRWGGRNDFHGLIFGVLRSSSVAKNRVPSATFSSRALGQYRPAYDASITPLELRNHNLYVQSIQQRTPLTEDEPLPSLHPNFLMTSRQKHVGGGGLIVQTKNISHKQRKQVNKPLYYDNIDWDWECFRKCQNVL